MLRPDYSERLALALAGVPATETTGADAALALIRGYTAEEVIDAASSGGLTDAQHRCVVLALAARNRAKRNRKVAA